MYKQFQVGLCELCSNNIQNYLISTSTVQTLKAMDKSTSILSQENIKSANNVP